MAIMFAGDTMNYLEVVSAVYLIAARGARGALPMMLKGLKNLALRCAALSMRLAAEPSGYMRLEIANRMRMIVSLPLGSVNRSNFVGLTASTTVDVCLIVIVAVPGISWHIRNAWNPDYRQMQIQAKRSATQNRRNETAAKNIIGSVQARGLNCLAMVYLG